jgi:hypothetical protein
MERDPQIDIERSPTRRGVIGDRITATTMGTAVAPVAPMVSGTQDLVHWAPVWAGFVVSLLTMIILGSLAAAIGLANVVPADPGAADAAATGGGVGAAVVVLIALFAGGYASGFLFNGRGGLLGAAHGVLVSGLVLTVAVLGTAMGSVGLGNAAANVFGALNMGRVFDPRAYANIPPEQIAATAARAAGWFTVIALLCVGAAALGGYLATRRENRAEAGPDLTA